MKIENIKLITYLYKKETRETFNHEMDFKNLSQLKKYVKECGGINCFKWNDKESQCKYFIKGEYNVKECYYEHRHGKYQWIDSNGYIIG